MLQQKTVADGGIVLSAYGDAKANTEVVGMLAADGQTAGVVVQVLEPPFQFACPLQDMVIEAPRPKKTVAAVVRTAVFPLLQHMLQHGLTGGRPGCSLL